MKKKLSLMGSLVLVLLSIASSFISINLNVLIGVISIIILVLAALYIKEHKNEFGKSPNGFGLIEFGAIFNVVGGVLFKSFNTIGSIFVLIGLLIALFSKK